MCSTTRVKISHSGIFSWLSFKSEEQPGIEVLTLLIFQPYLEVLSWLKPLICLIYFVFSTPYRLDECLTDSFIPLNFAHILIQIWRSGFNWIIKWGTFFFTLSKLTSQVQLCFQTEEGRVALLLTRQNAERKPDTEDVKHPFKSRKNVVCNRYNWHC